MVIPFLNDVVTSNNMGSLWSGLVVGTGEDPAIDGWRMDLPGRPAVH
ncbi:hypothetical protein AK812_SmicGene45820, partial [Symbiodinium microadriaticum]